MTDTVLGAIIGAGGAILGVLITIIGTAVGEAGRAQREKDARLHDVRQDLYTRFIGHMRLLLNWIDEMRENPEFAPEECEQSYLDFEDWQTQATRLTSEIDLIGSEDVIREVYSLRAAVFGWFVYRSHWQESGGPSGDDSADYSMTDLEQEDEDVDDDESAPGRDFEGESPVRVLVQTVLPDCLAAMREDLGAPKIREMTAFGV